MPSLMIRSRVATAVLVLLCARVLFAPAGVSAQAPDGPVILLSPDRVFDGLTDRKSTRLNSSH